MSKNIIFFDRDGVINKDTKYPHKIKDFIFNKDIFEVMNKLSHKFEFIIITNQSGINRNYYTKEDYDILTKWMLLQFSKNDISILDIFHCPHTPQENCICRKPKTGMIEQASKKYDIDLQKSWLIGDNISDIQCAINANIPNRIFFSDASISVDTHKISSLQEVLDIIK